MLTEAVGWASPRRSPSPPNISARSSSLAPRGTKREDSGVGDGLDQAFALALCFLGFEALCGGLRLPPVKVLNGCPDAGATCIAGLRLRSLRLKAK